MNCWVKSLNTSLNIEPLLLKVIEILRNELTNSGTELEIKDSSIDLLLKLVEKFDMVL